MKPFSFFLRFAPKALSLSSYCKVVDEALAKANQLQGAM